MNFVEFLDELFPGWNRAPIGLVDKALAAHGQIMMLFHDRGLRTLRGLRTVVQITNKTSKTQTTGAPPITMEKYYESRGQKLEHSEYRLIYSTMEPEHRYPPEIVCLESKIKIRTKPIGDTC